MFCSRRSSRVAITSSLITLFVFVLLITRASAHCSPATIQTYANRTVTAAQTINDQPEVAETNLAEIYRKLSYCQNQAKVVTEKWQIEILSEVVATSQGLAIAATGRFSEGRHVTELALERARAARLRASGDQQLLHELDSVESSGRDALAQIHGLQARAAIK